MSNKHFIPEAKREYRFRPLRTVLVCLLIAALFVSMSVGLSYAKYTSAPHLKASFKSPALQFYDEQYVVQERDRVRGNEFTTFGGKVKITVPADAQGDNLTNADYIVLQKVRENYIVNYELPEGQYKYDCSYYLYGFTYSTDARGFTNGNVRVTNDKKITVSFKVGSEYDSAFELSSKPNAARTGVTHAYDAASESVVFSDIATFAGGRNSTMDYLLEYDKPWWGNDITDVDRDVTINYNAPTVTVRNADELAQVAYLVNEGIWDFNGQTVSLGANISLYGEDDRLDLNNGTKEKRPWVPIGTYDHPFKGSFEGNGYSISGLNIRNFNGIVTGRDVNTAGLFGAVQNAGVIRNFNLSDVHISADLGNVGDDSYIGNAIGTVVGFDYGSDSDHVMRISNIGVSNLTVTSTSKYLGGIMGYGLFGSISDCYVSGATFLPSDHSHPGDASQVGGIIGLQHGRMDFSTGEPRYVNEKNISGCTVSGAVFYSGANRENGGIIAQTADGAVGVEDCSFSGTGARGGIVAQIALNEFYGTDGNLVYTIKNCEASDAPLFGGEYHSNTDGYDKTNLPTIEN